MTLTDSIDGVVIGLLMGFRDGAPLVVYAANPSDVAVPARSLARLSEADVGREVALLFEDGRRDRPLVIGQIVEPARRAETPSVVSDGETVRITAEKRIELCVGQSRIVLEADGHVTIRGTNLVSHARASNRIRGGSINLN